MGLSMAELIKLNAMESEVADLRALVAKQSILLGALVAVLGAGDSIEAHINPPVEDPVPIESEAIALAPIDPPPLPARNKPGPKPRFHGEHPDRASLTPATDQNGATA